MNEIDFKLTKRVETLKKNYLNIKPSIRINRALAYTEVAIKYPELAANLRRGKSFKKACETAPLLIQDQELIIGHPCGKARAGSFTPDTAWQWLEEELDTIETRPQDPYIISPEDKTIMKEKLFPFWKGKSLAEACEESLKEEGLWDYVGKAGITDLSYHMTSGGGDSSPGYDTILLKKGIDGLKREAEEKLTQLTQEDPNYEEKKHHYEASIEVCEGVLIYSKRLSQKAIELSREEKDPKRKKELQTIGAINQRVPKNPPKNFYEALQSLWTIQSLFLLEENQCSTSLGRVDQYLLSFYETDLKNNTFTEQEMFEQFCCFILKCSEIIWYTPSATAKYFAGYMPFINMCVGGVKRTGGDGTNPLTYLIMEAVKKVKVYQPTLACRIHNLSPQRYLDQVVELIKVGGGMPACHFDDAHIKIMLSKGYSLKDARDYSLMGCVEPQKSGKIHQWTAGGFTQWPITIELALNRGRLNSYGDQQWLDTGSIEQWKTYGDFESAVKKQLDFLIDYNCRGSVLIQKTFKKIAPTPYMSLFIEGCMEKGQDVTAGGACLYDGPGTIFAGLGTYADTMAAIKKLVFDEKKYTLNQIQDALLANWKGFEAIQKDCLKAPKYGNDEDYADLIAKEIIDYTEAKLNSYPSLFAKHIHGTLSQSFNTPLGEMLGATADGRNAYQPLSDGMSPSQGQDKKGPTAIIKSVSKLNIESMSLGMSHNFKFSKNFLDTDEGKNSVITLLKASSIMGNGQMQFICLENSVLLEAQKNPKAYRELIVRVAGYCAYFVELCEEVQNEIISRTTIKNT